MTNNGQMMGFNVAKIKSFVDGQITDTVVPLQSKLRLHPIAILILIKARVDILIRELLENLQEKDPVEYAKWDEEVKNYNEGKINPLYLN